MMVTPRHRLDFFLPPYKYGWRVEHPPEPHEAVAWRKMRGKYWTRWAHYTPYSWANIRKWVARQDAVYQVATAGGQICTVKRRVVKP